MSAIGHHIASEIYIGKPSLWKKTISLRKCSASNQKLPHDGNLFPEPYSSYIGLSRTPNLHARCTMKIYQNGEGRAFWTFLDNGKTSKKKKKTPPKRTEGDLVMNGLTRKAKRSIRIASDCYQDMVLNDRSKAGFCSFTSLTYRRIIPKDDKQAKKHLLSFLERVRRKYGNVHYTWVAERQKGKILENGEESYRLKHGQEVIHFHILTPERVEKQWLNRVWNEIVCNSFHKEGMITDCDRDRWYDEIEMFERYENRLSRFKTGELKQKPKSCKGKTKFLLLPNVIAVYKAGNYMAKYMSKDGENIIGNMWNMSSKSRELLIPREESKEFETGLQAKEFVSWLEKKLKEEKKMVFGYQIEYNNYTGFWTADGWRMWQYFDGYREWERQKANPPPQRKKRREKRELVLVQ